MVKASASGAKWKIAVAVAVATAVIGGTAWAGGGGEPTRQRDTQAERIVHGRETLVFKNVEQLVGSSRYVIKATVTDIQPGRSVGSVEEGGVEQARDVTLRVDVKFGKITLPATIVLEEWGWDETGAGYQVENVAWSKVGDKGFYFLKRSDDVPNRFRLMNTQGRALEAADGSLVLSADPESELTADIGWQDAFDLEQRIRFLLQPENKDQLQTVDEPPVVPSPSQSAPAPEDGADEPFPDDSVDDGSEPGAGG
ncbi:hypothetical protein ACIO1C_07505 [Streptomyces sp. NPDC087420]|uniref:hypothetical protein n=1 Tax=Streptomyces sp. NPDC087420 TaxID=3365785 RepID=UPI003836A886